MAARKPAPGPLSAFVLHSWDWSETSLIVELYTRERGRLVVAAKGAKRPHSQLRPVLLPFQRLQVQLGRTPADEAAEVLLLRSAEWTGGSTMPPGRSLFAAFYLNELLLKLLARQDPHPRLFDAYAEALSGMAAAEEAGIERSLRAFEITLLRELGLLPDLAGVTLTLEALEPSAAYAVHAESGVVAARPGGNAVTGGTLVAIEAALAHGGHAALCEAVRPASQPLRGILRQLLHYHLAGPPLRTRQVMADVQRLADAEAPTR